MFFYILTEYLKLTAAKNTVSICSKLQMGSLMAGAGKSAAKTDNEYRTE